MTRHDEDAALRSVALQNAHSILDSAPSQGTKIEVWVPPTMLPGAPRDAAPRSELA
jgi:hypothetical protein